VELAALDPTSSALEVGAAAIRPRSSGGSPARCVARNRAPSRGSAARLTRLGFANVEMRHADGRAGAPDRAPFDAILVAAAAPEVPDALFAQLAPRGRLIAPVGGAEQELRLHRRTDDGIVVERVCGVAFVPMTGG
jgi:protein-L-isoaspartate(D-aspartate) O-methyltransferase